MLAWPRAIANMVSVAEELNGMARKLQWEEFSQSWLKVTLESGYSPRGTIDLGDVRKPNPHDMCIVLRIAGNCNRSLHDFPIKNAPITISKEYEITGIKKIGEISRPVIIERRLIRSAVGGAR